MKLRFEATDSVRMTPDDPLVELLVDEVSVFRRKVDCSSFAPADGAPPNEIGDNLTLERSGRDLVLTWPAPPIDAEHDAARFYPVFRTPSPQQPFEQIGEPTRTSWRDLDAADPSYGTYCYLVSAKNAAGSSGEEPPP
ncbi:MAG: hypothetical protein JSV80_03850 [Acidobacteriota bacterium]|nr:MAG: hypothetical protein JSV80_03850 [Acidobacteriota bacterium]